MNQQVCKFVDQVVNRIKYKKIRPYIALEIEDHIETLKEDYVSQGLEEETAYQKAISQMGDATLIGQELHKTHKPHIEWSIIGMLTVLIGIGLYTMVRYHNKYGQIQSLHIKQIMWVVLGSIMFFIAYYFDYKKLQKWSLLGYLVGNLLLIFTLFCGLQVNGTIRSIQVGPLNISSFSIVQLFLLFGYSGLVLKIKANSFKGIVKLLGLIIFPVYLTLIQPNMSKACLLGIALLSLLLFYICGKEFEGNRRKSLTMIAASLISGMTLIVLMIGKGQLLQDYQRDRLSSFLNPRNDVSGRSYIYKIIKELYEGSKWIGDSNEVFTKNTLPNPFDEWILTVITSSYGRIIGIILMILIAGIILKMYLATSKINDLYGKVVSFAIATLFSVQFVANILMNFSYLPYTQSHLPFVSYGGTSIIFDMALMGLLLGIYRRKDIVTVQNFI